MERTVRDDPAPSEMTVRAHDGTTYHLQYDGRSSDQTLITISVVDDDGTDFYGQARSVRAVGESR